MSGATYPWARAGAVVHHIGFLSDDFDAVAALYGEGLGLELSEPETLDAIGISLLWVQAGDTAFEFIRPDDPASPAAERLRLRGPGLDHVAFEVDSVADSLAWCREHGVPLLDQVPRPGAKGSRIAFLAPEGAAGARIELVEVAAA